ncbi:MAG TPA: cobalamin B12-binding domain-containing protein [Candidatus Binataceae bacterium]|nr:cobalamin B12-binding domain-containing protein [Candidatus Binataceae bacterium]
MQERRIRVLIAKPGLDGHDRGAKVVAYALRDAGMEVIYTGLRQTLEHITDVAAQEDVDVIGLSILSGSHLQLTKRLIDSLRAKKMHIPVIVGGTIPPPDVVPLIAAGAAAVFPTGTALSKIAPEIRSVVEKSRAGDE